MNIIKRLFCKHDYKPMTSYGMLGYAKCIKCGKERYSNEDCEFTYIKFPDIVIKKDKSNDK